MRKNSFRYFILYVLLIILIIPLGFYFCLGKEPFKNAVKKIIREFAKGKCDISIGTIEFDPITLDLHLIGAVIKSNALGEVIRIDHLKTLLDPFNISFKDKKLYAHNMFLTDVRAYLGSAAIAECFTAPPKETVTPVPIPLKPKDIKIENFSIENGHIILDFKLFYIEIENPQIEKTFIEYGKNGVKLTLGKFMAMSIKVSKNVFKKPSIRGQAIFSFPDFRLPYFYAETEAGVLSLEGTGKIMMRGLSGMDLPLKFYVKNLNESQKILEKIIEIFDKNRTFTFNKEEGIVTGNIKIF